MSKRMKTREELLAEIDTLDLPEQTLETFRRVVNTVEEDLTEDQWRDYELDLDKYQRTMGMIRTGREDGRAEGRAEGLQEGTEKTQKSIAKAMKDNGIDVELIAKCCGLTKADIAAL